MSWSDGDRILIEVDLRVSTAVTGSTPHPHHARLARLSWIEHCYQHRQVVEGSDSTTIVDVKGLWVVVGDERRPWDPLRHG
jgi:hypothetical protein